jgi:lipopolysaccharide transport system ATP-binding protein
MPVVIDIENLSKKYLIHHENRPAYATLRETLSDQARRFANFIIRKPERHDYISEDFWALQDISLKIQQGDRIGIIGRNGAGKSTLLKILSRVTDPSLGKITLKGRLASLLEVGMGFHPELTGRENIFLNGAILGMSRKELKLKFDEIVAFSEVEKFLDTPVKRYSSGMCARLGFAVAAHLDPDILIVDEALAVGDVQFQEKCLKKMNEIGSSGRTILFVSHSIAAVLSLCNKGILLEKGRLVEYGPIDTCISRYLNAQPSGSSLWAGSLGDEHIKINEARINGSSRGFFYQGEEGKLEIIYNLLKPRQDLILGFSIFDSRSQLLAKSRLCDVSESSFPGLRSGIQKALFNLDMSQFHPGEYLLKIDCSLYNKKRILNEEILLKFSVYARDNRYKIDLGIEKEGICLGNRWQIH